MGHKHHKLLSAFNVDSNNSLLQVCQQKDTFFGFIHQNYFSFWISPTSSIPGRTALLITSYLILTNMAASAADFHSPTFTAMDAWFYACRFLVAAAILEFLFVLRNLTKAGSYLVKVGPQPIPTENQRSTKVQCAISEYYAFIILNLVFIIFCVVYFSVCISLR